MLTANARKLALISKSLKKNDRIDAQTLARLAHLDPNLLSAIRHRGASVQADLAVMRARDALVKVRTGLVNHVHFARSRDVGAYLGLTPRYGQSGAHDPQLGITMARASCPYTHRGSSPAPRRSEDSRAERAEPYHAPRPTCGGTACECRAIAF